MWSFTDRFRFFTIHCKPAPMKKRTAYFLMSLVVFLVSLGLLISGSSILVKPVIPESSVPVGTVSTWLGLIALSLLFVYGNNKLNAPKNNFEQTIRFGFKTCFFLALFWGLVSYLLAGNWSYNFKTSDEFVGSNEAYEVFRYYTLLVVGLPFLLALFYALISLQKRITRRHRS